jgi:beta-galactosidase
VKWDSRWYPGAGLYRNVWLVKTESVHVAHWGTYITTPEVSKERAMVKNVVTLDNQSLKSVTAQVVTKIFELSKDDKRGREVARSAPAKVSIEIGKNADVTLAVAVKNPELWDLKNPNRYLARTLVTVNGKLTDQYDTPFGIRTLKFTANNGFYINGKRVQMYGVCNHHDLGPLGAAINTSALRRQIRILKEMGCNAIRTSHNPPAPDLLDLCDKMGVMIMDETFDCWHKGKRRNDYGKIFKEWHVRDVEALALRDRNHPSVIMWSTGNEIPYRSS